MPRFPLSDPLHHPQTDAFILCTVPTGTGGETLLTVDLSLYGLDQSLLTNEFQQEGFAFVLHEQVLDGTPGLADQAATIEAATGNLSRPSTASAAG